jgi:Ca2+-binding RTX toxin-like protein
LGTKAAAAGIATVIAGAGSDTITSSYAISVDLDTNAATTLITGAATGNYTITTTDVTTATITATGSTGTLHITSANLTAGALALATGSGNVTVVGGDAGDTVTVTGLATAGQTFTGSVAQFNITAGAGAQTIVGGAASNTINGGDGADSITGGAASDTLNGDSGNDTITGSGGSDTINGGDGADSIVGGAVIDQITGGAGADTITGGSGVDIFIFGTDGSIAGTSLDSITDFNTATGSDIIRLAGTVALAATNASAATAGLTVTVSAGGLAGFASADDTYAEKVTALQTDAGTKAAQAASLFVDGSDTYVFFAGATTATTDDQIIKLTGVSGASVDTITPSTTDITIG